MNTRAAGCLLVLSISVWAIGAALAAKGFDVKPVESYPTRQAANGLTIAAVAYDSEEQQKAVFGKAALREFGILPVLLVMQNDSGKALKLDTMEVNYLTPQQRKVEETPASDVQYLDGPKRPNFGGSPLPIPRRKPKSKLAYPEIEGYGFNAKMLPANDKAHGFVYFQTSHRPGSGAKIYIRGIVEAPTGKELLYFEVPLDPPPAN